MYLPMKFENWFQTGDMKSVLSPSSKSRWRLEQNTLMRGTPKASTTTYSGNKNREHG